MTENRNQGSARAALGQNLLATLEAEDPALEGQVLASLSAETRKDYDTKATLRWVEMRSHMELSDAIRDASGAKNNAAFWQKSFADVLGRKLFQGFVEGVVRMSGSTPESFVRYSPLVLRQLFRDVVEMEILPGRDDYFAIASFSDFPAKLFTLDCFVEGTQGAYRSLSALTGVELVVDILHVDPRGDFQYGIRRQ